MHAGSKIFGERQLEIFEVGENAIYILPSRCDKGVTVFHNLDADAISEVYISDSAPASTER